MGKSHYLTIGVFTILFLVLYFGFDTKPHDILLAEKSRASFIETTNIQNLLTTAREEMRADEMGVIDAINMRLEMAETDSSRIEVLENLSSSWYQNGYYGIAGYYAEEIAKIKEDELSWSIAGTTYATGIKRADNEKVKSFCVERARKALENAISINPANVNHKINLAVTFAEHPVAENPMKGIMMLLDLNKQNPENVSVLYQLARLGIQTGQFDKAIERINKALSLDPENQRIICLAVDAYNGIGNNLKAEEFSRRCEL
ncbi:tetratricopeptide repeat protein [Portibacter marinus]|uniref:tetratricopeptide repeat protein n=1 Tax=Portibacter marinus TaxID=2898660 RepID=UPI001F2299BB|nr:tetratricopeptide repeat protein [Portibacter marinus]